MCSVCGVCVCEVCVCEVCVCEVCVCEVCVCEVCDTYVGPRVACLTYSPVAVSQMLTVLSKEPVRVRSPVVLKLTQITSAEWPCVCAQRHHQILRENTPLPPPPLLPSPTPSLPYSFSPTHSECVLLYASLYTPEFGSGVHTACGHQRTGGIETKAHNLPCMATERVETFATLCAPQLREREYKPLNCATILPLVFHPHLASLIKRPGCYFISGELENTCTNKYLDEHLSYQQNLVRNCSHLYILVQ